MSRKLIMELLAAISLQVGGLHRLDIDMVELRIRILCKDARGLVVVDHAIIVRIQHCVGLLLDTSGHLACVLIARLAIAPVALQQLVDPMQDRRIRRLTPVFGKGWCG